MTQFNRRQWLKAAGLSGTLVALGGTSALPNSTRYEARPTGSLIRLNSNENPNGPSPKVRKAIEEAFDVACRYPRSYSEELVKKIAEKEGVTTDHIVVTGGSTEGLNITGLLYAKDGGEIIAGSPTFLAMLNYAKKFGSYVHMVPLDNNLVHDLNAMSQRVNSNTRIVYICNPSNPTGTITKGKELLDFCDSLSNDSIVFADEAYFDYIEEPDYPSMLQLVKQDKNVIVCRTFSKVYGLAGMRIGYLVARPDIARRLRNHLPAYTNILAIRAASAALDDQEFYNYSLDLNRKAKSSIYKTLDALNLNYIKSHTNFIFFESGREITELGEQMKSKGLRIGRPFPPLTKWCRISTGTLEEVNKFNQALTQVMA